MKKFVLVLLLVGVCCGVCQAEMVGKYQIVINENAGFTFLLNTETGSTWIIMRSKLDETFYMWIKVEKIDK